MNRWIAVTVVLTLVFLVPAAAGDAEEEKPHPLGVWTEIVGGPWHATGEWNGGMAFEARLVAEWGPGKTNVRLRIFVPAKDGEYLRYDSVYFVHPESKKPTYLSTAFDGETATGEFTVEKDTVTFVFPAKAPMPAIRSTYRFGEKDRCRWTVEQKKDEEWTGMLDVTYARGEIAAKKRVATKPPDRKDLDPLSRLIGKFDVVGKQKDGDPRKLAVERTFGLGRLIVTDTFIFPNGKRTLKDRGFLWFDREKKAFREFGFLRNGVILEATYSVDGDDVVHEFTVWAGGGTARGVRKIRIKNGDRYRWDDHLLLPSGRKFRLDHDMVATRVKEKD